MTTDHAATVPEEWKAKMGWQNLSPAQQQAIGQYGFYMFGLGMPTVDDIDEIKYEGRLIVLGDGSRWEVSDIDVITADMWTPPLRVAVIDDVMYNLDDAEHVDVTEEY